MTGWCLPGSGAFLLDSKQARISYEESLGVSVPRESFEGSKVCL